MSWAYKTVSFVLTTGSVHDWSCDSHVFFSGILELKGQLTNEEDFQRIMNFMYVESQEELDRFSAWIHGLRKPKVQGMCLLLMTWSLWEDLAQYFLAWWDHKVQNKWILPAIIKCLSKIPPDDWDRVPATTNVGEGQHHWTNINTGIQHSLLEAILTYIGVFFSLRFLLN